MDKIRRSTSSLKTGIAYYPDYLAQVLGYFEDEQIDIVADAPGHGPFVADALATGASDIGLGGMWRPLFGRRKAPMWCFAQLVDSYSGVLLARTQTEPFTYDQLVGKVVTIPSGNPSAWIMLKHLIQSAGVDPADVHFLHTFGGDEATLYFKDGIGDFYLTGEPTSNVLVAQGFGTPVASLSSGGTMPASVYYATPEFLAREDHAAGRFVRAINRALVWLAAHDPLDAPGVFPAFFAGWDVELVAESVRGCKELGVWNQTARISEEGLLRWQEILVADGSCMSEILPFSDIVDNRAVDWAESHPRA